MVSKLPVSPWVIWHCDSDKRHRCPFRYVEEDDPRYCENGYISTEETGWKWRFRHVYQCNKCHARVASWPLLPSPEESWKSRAQWFWWYMPKSRWSGWYWPHYTFKLERWWYGQRLREDGDIQVLRIGVRDRVGIDRDGHWVPHFLYRWGVVKLDRKEFWDAVFWKRSSAEAYREECLREDGSSED